MEMHHIETVKRGGSDDADNLIPLCFDCHAEAGSYNVDHPRGRKLQPNELRTHRDQWIEICKTNPGALTSGGVSTEAGPLQGLLGELEFNLSLVRSHNPKSEYVSHFHTREFERSISEGVVPVLPPNLRKSLFEAYRMLEQYNACIKRHENLAHEIDKIRARELIQCIERNECLELLLRGIEGLFE